MEHRKPFAVWIPKTVIDTKNRKLTFVGIKLEYTAETLHAIASTLKKHGITLLTGMHSVEVGEKVGYWVFVVDYTDTKYSVSDIKKILEEIDGVLEVKVGHHRIGNVVTPEFNYDVEIHFEPVILFTSSTWNMILRGLEERFGRAKDVFLYFMGFEYGKRFVKTWSDVLKAIGSSEGFIKFALESLRGFNWITSYEIEELNLEEGLVKIHAISINIDGYMFKGFMEGIMSELLRERKALLLRDCTKHVNCKVLEML